MTDAPKGQRMFAAIRPDGWIFEETICRDEKWTIKVTKNYFNEPWEYLEKQGYRIVPVIVTLEDNNG